MQAVQDVADAAQWEVRPLSGALGAEVLGVDLAAPLDAAAIAALRALWLRYQVIFFRDQKLDSDQFLTAARRFGEPVEYPFVKGLDGYPEIIAVLKQAHETTNFGGIWHTDTAYLDVPPMATMLIARETPPHGGDTLFSSLYAAHDALSPGLRETLSTLRAVNTSAKADVSRTREDRIRDTGRTEKPRDYAASHPVIRTHPETGRKALYVNIAHTHHFDGWTEEESTPLLNHLYALQARVEFTCRFSWRPGSIALWDNRCVLHNPINDYHGHRRLMHRITLRGDTPV